MSCQSLASCSFPLRTAVCCVPAALLLVSAAHAQPLLNTATVASQGQTAPGGGSFQLFTVGTPSEDLNLFSVNGQGRMIFRSVLIGAGVTSANNVGLYTSAADETLLVAREGSPAAGLPASVLYGDFTGALIDNSGSVAFIGGLTGAGITASNNEALWAGPVGSFALAVQRGAAAPGVAAPGVFGDLDATSLALSTSGTVAFRGTLTGAGVTTTTDRGIWAGQAGSIALVAREGDTPPGTGAGVIFSNFDDLNPNVTGDAGVKASAAGVLITATLAGTGVTTSNDYGYWYRPNNGALVKVAREGDAAPNLTGVTYLALQANSINAAGNVLFRPTLTGTGVTAANNALLSIWQPSGATIDVVRKGVVVPAIGQDITITEFITSPFLQPRLASDNSVAWVCTLGGSGTTGANNRAVLYRSPGREIQNVLRIGDDAPDIGGDVRFLTIQGFALGGNGQVIISVRLAGTGVVTADDDALYSWTNPRGLRLISRESARISVNLDETRDVIAGGIVSVRGFGTQEGRRQSISDSGQIVYRAAFTDGSARFLSVNALLYPCGLSDFGGSGASSVYDGQLDNNDFIVFIQRFFEQDFLADIGSAGGEPGSDLAWDNNDFIVFIQNFFAGC